MRVSQNYNIESLLQEVNRTRTRIDKLQSNLTTGKRINKISDDPENLTALFRFKNVIKENKHYQRNIGDALNFMTSTSQALDDAVNIMMSVKESAIRGITSIGDSQWEAEANQVNQLLKEMVDIGNRMFNDRYIFGGSNTKDNPFVLSPDESQVIENPEGTNGILKIQYGNTQIEQYNVSGESAFKDNVDVFQTLIDLREAIKSRDSVAVEGLLENINQSIDQLSLQNTNIGSKINRFDLYHQQYENQDIQLQEMLSEIEDTDIAKAIMELQMEETSLNATLQVLAKTFNVSLMDFIG
jgi:flagellar hook-associated protein 3 FlgL